MKYYEDNNLLDNITFQELIDTIVCNEYKKNYSTIYRVFNDLLDMRIEAAREMFRVRYDDIKKEVDA